MGKTPTPRRLLEDDARAWIEALKFVPGYRSEWNALVDRYGKGELDDALDSLRRRSPSRRARIPPVEAALALLGERWALGEIGPVHPYIPGDRGRLGGVPLYLLYPQLFLPVDLDGGSQALPGLPSVKHHALVLVDLRLSNPALGVYFDELRAEQSVKVIRLTRRRPWGSDDLDPVQAFRIRRLFKDRHPNDVAKARAEAKQILAHAGSSGRPDRVVRRVLVATGRMIREVEELVRGVKVVGQVWSPHRLVTQRSGLSPL